ncbi:unnamed protein product [Nippostrongylus brasiliensis]|uniref:RES domain-containing protein n=1 Tax=Nippostrongylus brasiliensis TaxID=27835 RepID=A0A0N4XHG7_NIPBR|nr:unnamed protein product [Nippostrongylus brasiliensis]
MKRDFLKEYNHETYYFCNSCSGRLTEHFGLYANVDCSFFRLVRSMKIWPLYLRIDDLQTRQANDFMNTILRGSIFCNSKLQMELRSLGENPIVIEYEVSVKLFRGVADMAAQNDLFGIPRWTSDYGCSKCLIPGTRLENQHVWIAESRADIVPKTLWLQNMRFVEDHHQRRLLTSSAR